MNFRSSIGFILLSEETFYDILKKTLLNCLLHMKICVIFLIKIIKIELHVS